jgi:hypothetical protein
MRSGDQEVQQEDETLLTGRIATTKPRMADMAEADRDPGGPFEPWSELKWAVAELHAPTGLGIPDL